MAIVDSDPRPGSGGPGPRNHFQSHPGAAGEGPGGADNEGPVRPQDKVTVKHDGKELRKHLNVEEWILEQLTLLYNCQEKEIPELEIDVDELLDMESDDTRAVRVKELLVDCNKPTEPAGQDLGHAEAHPGKRQFSHKTATSPQSYSSSNTGGLVP